MEEIQTTKSQAGLAFKVVMTTKSSFAARSLGLTFFGPLTYPPRHSKIRAAPVMHHKPLMMGFLIHHQDLVSPHISFPL